MRLRVLSSFRSRRPQSPQPGPDQKRHQNPTLASDQVPTTDEAAISEASLRPALASRKRLQQTEAPPRLFAARKDLDRAAERDLHRRPHLQPHDPRSTSAFVFNRAPISHTRCLSSSARTHAFSVSWSCLTVRFAPASFQRSLAFYRHEEVTHRPFPGRRNSFISKYLPAWPWTAAAKSSTMVGLDAKGLTILTGQGV